MKTPQRRIALFLMCLGALPSVNGETLDTLVEFGNAATEAAPFSAATPTPIPRGYTSGPMTGDYTITAGGADFWGGSDAGSFLYDSASGARTGDFSAIVRMRVGETGEVIADGNGWGRSGIMARTVPGAANSANFSVYRRFDGAPGGDGITMGQRPSAGAGTDSAGAVFGVNLVPHQTTWVWLGLHRLGNRVGMTWAPDVAGTPGTWSVFKGKVASADQLAPVTVGLGHQNHNNAGTTADPAPNNRQISTATYRNFMVGPYDHTLGVFPPDYSCNIAFNGNDVFLTASGTEPGAPAPQDVNWEVRFVGPEQLTPGGLRADIYLQGNAGNLAAFNTMTAGVPNGTTRIERINWAANVYNETNAGGINLFAQAVPGSFLADQENYGVQLTGEIFIPSDAARGNVEQVAFHDGVDDYTLLQIDGTTLIDDNSWTNRAGDGNAGGGQGILNVSDPKFDDGEWVSFRMGTWEGGGGDDAYLVWDALDRTGTDPVTGGSDGVLNSYTGAASGMTPTIIFTNDASDQVPSVNFRTLTGGVLATQSGTGQPSNLLLNQRLNMAPVVGTKAIEVYLDGNLCISVPVEPTIGTADFTGFQTVRIELLDVGGGGTSDVDMTSLTVTRDGAPITPMITKTGIVTTIVDTFVSPPAPYTTFNYVVTGNTTAATGTSPFSLSASVRSFALLEVLRAGLGAPPNATVGWEVMEFTGVTLGGAEQGFRDAQFIIRDNTPAVTAVQPFINHTDPETNPISGDWLPDLPILTNTAADDNNYVTYARTTLTIGAGEEGTYTFRIRGDDGYGLRINGATAISVAGDGTNRVDSRNSSVFFPNFTGDSNAFGVFDFPAPGDYLVEFFGFEGGGGSFQELSWAAGAFTAIGQTVGWRLVGDTSGSTFVSPWGVIPESVLPPLPNTIPGGWAAHIWYGATNGAAQAVDNLDQTMRFLRDLAPPATSTFTADFLGFVPELNHSDNGGDAGVFNPTASYPGDPIAGDDTDRIALLARAIVVAPADGNYSVQIRSDDGFLFRFIDPNDQFIALDGGGQLHPSAQNEIFFAAGTGDSNTRAVVHLTEGPHEVVFVWWEGGGGSHFEISTAPGAVLNHGPEYALLTATPSATNLYLGLDTLPPFRITDVTYNRSTQMISLTWLSQLGKIYGIYYSQDLVAPTFQADIDDSISSGGETTTYMFQHPFFDPMNPGAPLPVELFFRVQDNSTP